MASGWSARGFTACTVGACLGDGSSATIVSSSVPTPIDLAAAAHNTGTMLPAATPLASALLTSV